MPEALNIQKAVNLQEDRSKLFLIGGSYNINTYEGLLEFKKIHNNIYGLATKDELGFRYKTDFQDNFIFIGKYNRIVGTLSDKASIEEMDLMIKRTLASFYGLSLKKDKDMMLLSKNTTIIDLKDYFHADDFETIEFQVRKNTNHIINDIRLSGNLLHITGTSVNGISDLSISASIKGTDLFAYTDIVIINPSNYYEDFEIAKLDDSEISWIHSGDSDWFITEEESFFGSKSLRSGEINSSQTSALSVELNLSEPGVVVFAYKTSSRPYYNKLNFYIDGLNISDKESPHSWSGENDWRLVSFNIRRGPRAFKWEYKKSPYDPLYNQDRVWIDMVIIPDKHAEIAGGSVPEHHQLEFTAYPNPFNPSTEISFSLNENYQSELLIFDIKGRMVTEVFKGQLNKGMHSFEFDGSKLSSGIYYSVLRYGDKFVTNKLILAK